MRIADLLVPGPFPNDSPSSESFFETPSCPPSPPPLAAAVRVPQATLPPLAFSAQTKPEGSRSGPSTITPPPKDNLLTSFLCCHLEQTVSQLISQSSSHEKELAASHKMVDYLVHDAARFPQEHRQALWTAFAHYANFCASLGFDPFPLVPKKVALYLARRVNLPCSFFLRYISPLDAGSGSINVKRAAASLQIIAQATSQFWRTESFVKESSMVNEALNCPLPPRSSAKRARDEVQTPFFARGSPSPRVRSLRFLVDNFAQELVSLRIQTEAPYPTPSPDTRILRRLSHTPPENARLLLADYYAFDAFCTSHSFPTHPLTATKLAFFALAHSPGPAHRAYRDLDAAQWALPAPARARRLDEKSFERALQHLEMIQEMARAPDDDGAEWDGRQWSAWKQELLVDAGGARTSAPGLRPPARSSSSHQSRAHEYAPSGVPKYLHTPTSTLSQPNKLKRPSPPAPSHPRKSASRTIDSDPPFLPLPRKTPPPLPPRRAPPLPAILSSSDISQIDGRSVALHRPRRAPLIEMEVLDWKRLGRKRAMEA